MGVSAQQWWSKETVAVVTGSSKGIGLQIVKDLAKTGVTTVLTGRDAGRGEKVVAALKAEGYESVVFHPLEITSAESIDSLAAWLKSEFGGFDILINNAGVLIEKLSYEVAKETINANYYAVKLVINKLLPVLRPGGRILNTGSSLGQLALLQDVKVAEKLGDEEHLTEDVVDSVAAEYLEDVKAGRTEKKWSKLEPQYAESKMFIGAYTRALAKVLEGVYVNVYHPGYIETDMTTNLQYGKKATVQDAADTPVWLVLLPKEDYPNGQFFYNREQFAW